MLQEQTVYDTVRIDRRWCVSAAWRPCWDEVNGRLDKTQLLPGEDGSAKAFLGFPDDNLSTALVSLSLEGIFSCCHADRGRQGTHRSVETDVLQLHPL